MSLKGRVQRGDRIVRAAMRRDVAIDVIDEHGVERALFLQCRRDDPPDEGCEPPLETAAGRRRHEHVARLVQRRDLMFVVGRRRLDRHWRPHAYLIERGQRVVVPLVRLVALLLQPEQRGVERFVLGCHRCASVRTNAPTGSCAESFTGTRAASVVSHSDTARAPASGGGVIDNGCA